MPRHQIVGCFSVEGAAVPCKAVKESKTIIWNGNLTLKESKKKLQQTPNILEVTVVSGIGPFGILLRSFEAELICQGPMGVFEMAKFETGTPLAFFKGPNWDIFWILPWLYTLRCFES